MEQRSAMRITGIILAGGKSSRMGEEKAFIMFNGVRLIERAISVLESFCDTILISSDNEALACFGYPVVEDEHKGIGPIAGLVTALKVSQNPHHLVIPCDTPFVGPIVYERLIRSSEGYDAVIAGTSCGLREPLIGYYHRTALTAIQNQISRGDFKLQNALDSMNMKVIVFPQKSCFKNINAPSDLVSLSGENRRDRPVPSMSRLSCYH